MKIERITSYDRFVDTKKDWNSLLSNSGQNCPFLTHQWFDAWWRCFGQNGALEILFFRDESGSPIGIAPLMISDDVLRFMASPEVTDYCDFISCAEKRAEFYNNLSDHFQKSYSECSRIELINIPEASSTLLDFRRLATECHYICEVEESEVVPVLVLPESYEDYIQSLGRKNRHELRRKLRKLETLGQIRIEQVTEPEGLGDAIKEFISLHRKSSPSKRNFWQMHGMSDFFSEFVHLFSSENWMELNMLYVENKWIAALLNFQYEDISYFYNIAYDKDFSAYSPGFCLFDHSIKQAITKNKRSADFLRGREKYKYFFGAKDSRIYNLKLEKREKIL